MIELCKLKQYDKTTYFHSLEVAYIADRIASRIFLYESDVNMTKTAALYHDIGMLDIPIEVLNKKEPLTDKEKEMIDSHAFAGYLRARHLGMPEEIAQIILVHHGYDDAHLVECNRLWGKAGSFAEIVQIAEMFSTLTSNEINENPVTPEEAISMIEQERFPSHYTEILSQLFM